MLGPQCANAADEQAGADQEDGRRGDLTDENQRARLGAPRQPRRHDIAPLQHGLQQHRGSTQRRDQPEQQTGRNRHGRRERDGAEIERDVQFERRRAIRNRCDGSRADQAGEEVGTPRGEQQARGGADAGEQQVFRQQLAHQPQAGGAERDADGQLAIAGSRAHEQQVGDVGADHEQRQADGDRKDGQRLRERGALRRVAARGRDELETGFAHDTR